MGGGPVYFCASMAATSTNPSTQDVQAFREALMADYRLMCVSREASLLGRKEVLTGKAKFGIFGDGKEMAQVALAKVVRPGDWRSGYYRDQTFMMARSLLSVQQYFAALYAHADVEADPTSGGRQMGGHFATRTLNEDGSWKNLMADFNSSADVSPTAAQMPRLLGLAQASKVFRALPELADRMRRVSRHGQAKRYFHTDIGVNGRIDTLQAAILLGKWPNFAKEVDARGRIGAAYSRKLQAAGVTTTPQLAAGNTSVYAQYTVQVDHRVDVQALLKDKGIPTAVHYPTLLCKQPALRCEEHPLLGWLCENRQLADMLQVPERHNWRQR